MRFARIAFLLGLVTCLSAQADGFEVPLGQFRNTYYYSVQEASYVGLPLDSAIFDMNDQVIARVSTAFRRAVDIEGTGKLVDGRVINFSGVKGGMTRYHVTIHPYGHGVGDCALQPFHTIAVDPREIPLGSVVRIRETIGMVLPDGTIHDGIWRADDIGAAIQRDRIDLFVGNGNQGKVLDRAGIYNLEPLTVDLIQPAHYPNCTDQYPR